jgi:hypothetical protein
LGLPRKGGVKQLNSGGKMEIEEFGEPTIEGFAAYFGKGSWDTVVKCSISLAWQTLITLGYDLKAAVIESAEFDDLWERRQAIYPYALLCALQQFLGVGPPNIEELADLVFSCSNKFNPQYIEWQLQDKVIQAVLETASALNSTVDRGIDPLFRNQTGLFTWAEFLETDPKLLKAEGLDKPFLPAAHY